MAYRYYPGGGNVYPQGNPLSQYMQLQLQMQMNRNNQSNKNIPNNSNQQRRNIPPTSNQNRTQAEPRQNQQQNQPKQNQPPNKNQPNQNTTQNQADKSPNQANKQSTPNAKPEVNKSAPQQDQSHATKKQNTNSNTQAGNKPIPNKPNQSPVKPAASDDKPADSKPMINATQKNAQPANTNKEPQTNMQKNTPSKPEQKPLMGNPPPLMGNHPPNMSKGSWNPNWQTSQGGNKSNWQNQSQGQTNVNQSQTKQNWQGNQGNRTNQSNQGNRTNQSDQGNQGGQFNKGNQGNQGSQSGQGNRGNQSNWQDNQNKGSWQDSQNKGNWQDSQNKGNWQGGSNQNKGNWQGQNKVEQKGNWQANQNDGKRGSNWNAQDSGNQRQEEVQKQDGSRRDEQGRGGVGWQGSDGNRQWQGGSQQQNKGWQGRNNPQSQQNQGSFNKYGQSATKKNFYGHDKVKEKVQSLAGPQLDLPALEMQEKKFNAYSRLFVGNVARSTTEAELKEMFEKYGEVGEIYINRESSYSFVVFDFRANAAKAMRELDGKSVSNRFIKIRFATISEAIKVKNLSQYVSNELLEKAFSVFGTVESCRVVVDERGMSKGEGVIIFKDKKSAIMALRKCQEEVYYLSGCLRPVVVDSMEPREDDPEGQPESSLPRNEDYNTERMIGPHFADPGSFEYEFGLQWKHLFKLYEEKKSALENDFYAEMEQLDKKMTLAKVEYETERLRKELAEREAQTALLRRHFGSGGDLAEVRNQPGSGGANSGGGGGATGSYGTKRSHEAGQYDDGYDYYGDDYNRDYNRSYGTGDYGSHGDYDMQGYRSGGGDMHGPGAKGIDRPYDSYGRGAQEGGYPRDGSTDSAGNQAMKRPRY